MLSMFLRMRRSCALLVPTHTGAFIVGQRSTDIPPLLALLLMAIYGKGFRDLVRLLNILDLHSAAFLIRDHDFTA